MNIYVIIAIDLLGCIMTVIFMEIAVRISNRNDIKRKERIKNGIHRKSLIRRLKEIFKRN